jgi:hypothetical protein
MYPEGDNVIFAETLQNFQHMTQLNPESRSYTVILLCFVVLGMEEV